VIGAEKGMSMPRGRVLIIEDDPDIRWTVRFILEDQGYEVFEAPDGVVGRDLLRVSGQLLVILLDYMMPRLNGVELLREVAADGYTMQRHAFILLTAAHDLLPPSAVALLKALAIPIVTKPFELDTLLTAVAAANGRLSAGREEAAARDL
jgi:two-component system nitrogen regulation response regulator NtrX